MTTPLIRRHDPPNLCYYFNFDCLPSFDFVRKIMLKIILIIITISTELTIRASSASKIFAEFSSLPPASRQSASSQASRHRAI